VGTKPVFGLIGGIASGKSTAAGMLRDLGVEVIDADVLAHYELAQDDVVEVLAHWWPNSVVAGVVDRKALAKVIFSDQRLLGRLEGLLWPRIHARIKDRIRMVDGGMPIKAVAIDGPLLLEAGTGALCDCLIFIDADDATRLGRTRARGWDDGELARREAMQWPLAKKRRMADHILTSDSTLKDGLIAILGLGQCPT